MVLNICYKTSFSVQINRPRIQAHKSKKINTNAVMLQPTLLHYNEMQSTSISAWPLCGMLRSSRGTSLSSVFLTASPVHVGVPCHACVCFLSVLAMVAYRSIILVVLADALPSSSSFQSPWMLCCRDHICSCGGCFAGEVVWVSSMVDALRSSFSFVGG